MTGLGLAWAIDATQHLVVIGRVPVQVEENEMIGPLQIDAGPAGLPAQKEDFHLAGFGIERVDQVLAFSKLLKNVMGVFPSSL